MVLMGPFVKSNIDKAPEAREVLHREPWSKTKAGIIAGSSWLSNGPFNATMFEESYAPLAFALVNIVREEIAKGKWYCR